MSKKHLSDKAEIQQFRHRLQEVQTEIYRDFKAQSDFFFYEKSNPHFYKTKQSDHLQFHLENQEHIRHSLIDLLGNAYSAQYHSDSTVLSVIDLLMLYSRQFSSMVDLQFEKGFKDFGTIGKMRGYVHAMETCPEFELADVLMLRRHEKDYLLRNDQKYQDKLHLMANSMVIKLERQYSIAAGRKDTLRLLLNDYVMTFDKVVRYDIEQGIVNNTGLKYKLDKTKSAIVTLTSSLLERTMRKEKALLYRLNVFNIVLVVSVAVASVFLSIWLSKRLTNRISVLSNGMRLFVESGFGKVEDGICATKQKDEVSELTNNYIVMREKIIELVYSFKKKVEERTAEIRFQRDQLEKQAEEIAAQRDRLSDQNKYIDEQKTLVERQNSEILDSIKYAAGIQQTMMPDKQELSSVFENIFVFYRPLDIISGDYYWVHHTGDDALCPNCSFFAVADCTGHGVPGALMSMLGITYMNEIVHSQNVYDPGDILEHLRENVVNAMRYRNSRYKAYDGMDIALGMIHHNEKILHFAGANRDAHIIRKGELITLQGDKMPIGRHAGKSSSFATKKEKLQDGDCVYLFSDGYTDQFGGADNKKYTKRRFKDFLVKLNADKAFADHYDAIELEFNTWQGQYPQIDDVSVLGLQWVDKSKEPCSASVQPAKAAYVSDSEW